MGKQFIKTNTLNFVDILIFIALIGLIAMGAAMAGVMFQNFIFGE